MSIITEITVPADQFALAETLQRRPEMVIEIERVVAYGPSRILPYFWIADGDYEAFEQVAQNDPSVEDLSRIDTFDETVLYRANWVQNVECILYTYTEPNAILLDATGRNEHWELQLRFDDETSLQQFRTCMSENEVTLDVERLYYPSRPISRSQPVLTDKQREAILAGLRSGYYEIPRETAPKELAEELGISPQALSKRFRRAHRALAENAVPIHLSETE